MRNALRILLLIPELLLGVVLTGLCALWFDMRVSEPLAPGEQVDLPPRMAWGDGWRVGDDRLARNDHGLWEAVIHGDELQRGAVLGVLAKELIERQEELFVERIELLVPNKRRLGWIKHFVAFFNRDLEEHVPLEYRREIFALSRSFSPAFDFIGSPYERALNYHAAHDIGHALQDLALVGCTSFAAWGEHSADGQLLIGRNFDFHLGEDFACDKLVLFVEPTTGHPFAQVTWGGMMGTVSGMNTEGLTVTINAARSALPTGARTPISLLAREILQYAATIDEAVAIARRRDVFVSESILVGSARDGRAAIIEKAPDGMDVYDPGNGLVVCANHYQSARFRDSTPNVENMRDSDSMARHRRMAALTSGGPALTPADAARILRERNGPDGRPVGLGNPIAIDQLIAHHSIIFQPAHRRFWVSAGPWTLGAYLCYDLDTIFAGRQLSDIPRPLHLPGSMLPADTLLISPVMDDLVWHRAMRTAIRERLVVGRPFRLDPHDEQELIRTDPQNPATYEILGDLYHALGDRDRAAIHYREALARAVPSEAERRSIQQRLSACVAN